jgi:anti-anti-sigma regulatory factor
MTLKINRHASGGHVIVQLVGTMRAEHLDEVKAQVTMTGDHVTIDVGELTLVSVEGIRFLNACQDKGADIVNASPYIFEWMTLERNTIQ